MTIAPGHARARTREHRSCKLNTGCGYGLIQGFFNPNLITFLSSSQNANNGGGFCHAKRRSGVSHTEPGSARGFQKVMLIFTIMRFPGPWEPTADLAGLLHESGCLRSPVKCVPSPNFAGNEPCVNITGSSGYLNAKSHQTSGQASGVERACSALAGFITSLSLMQFNTFCAPGHAERLSERSHRGGAAGDGPVGELPGQRGGLPGRQGLKEGSSLFLEQ